ncbi:hydroxymethylbilane synthase [Cryptobacterium curtum]
MTDKTITIGTRGSKLALWQAEKVRALIQATFPEVHCAVKVIRTKGDKILDVALSKIGDKGLFTKELERCLLEGEVDVCVHSMKDMPTVLPEGLFIAGVTERACPNDVIVASAKGLTLSDLPADARVATGSLRRVAQLARLRPDVTACEIRGNIDTRIGRVLAGEFDAAILAAAGLYRLGLEEQISSLIPTEEMIPAVGQGAIALEARADDREVAHLCTAISHQPTLRAVEAERYIMRALEGGCQVPMGAYATESEDEQGRRMIHIDAFVATLDGTRFLRAQASTPVDQAIEAAGKIVDDLVSQGATEILEALR